jgi:glucose-6-phosphate 1-epimerase
VLLKQKDELEYLEISNQISTIKISLQGAHIFHFKVKDRTPLLFLSKSTFFKRGKAIRGGIPICWPWFGAHPTNNRLANHGFARTSLWKHETTEEVSPQKTRIVLSLCSSIATRTLWPYEFKLSLEIVMSEQLEVSLISENCDAKTIEITQALHSYLQVCDIESVRVAGLSDTRFYNKLHNSYDHKEVGNLQFKQEIDRVYYGVKETIMVDDGKRNIEVQTEGSNTVVVWNPGKELGEKMVDLDSYKEMLCIESANLFEDKVTLERGESFKLTTILS